MNDSLFDDTPRTFREAVAIGLRTGATHVLECVDHDGEVEYVLVKPGECIGSVEKACWRSSFNVNTLDLDEMRQAEAVQ